MSLEFNPSESSRRSRNDGEFNFSLLAVRVVLHRVGDFRLVISFFGLDGGFHMIKIIDDDILMVCCEFVVWGRSAFSIYKETKSVAARFSIDGDSEIIRGTAISNSDAGSY